MSSTKFALLVIVVLIGIGSLFYPMTSTFIVEATTEYVAIKTTEKAVWFSESAAIQPGCNQKEEQHFKNVQVAVPIHTEVTFRKLSPFAVTVVLRGPSDIQIEGNDEAEIAATLVCFQANDFLTINVMGEFEIGWDIADEQTGHQPILNSGKVTVLANVLLGKAAFVAKETNLFPGDRIASTLGVAGNLLVLPTTATVSVTARMSGSGLYVWRWGSKGEEVVAAPFMARLTNDPLLAGIWAVVLFVLARLKL